MKLISFIVGRHSFGTHLACVPNGRDGRTFVRWRRAERSRMRRQGKLLSCDAPISALFSIGEAEKRNSPVSSLSAKAEPTKPPRDRGRESITRRKNFLARENQTPGPFPASNKSWRLQPPTEGQPGVMVMGNVAPGFAVCGQRIPSSRFNHARHHQRRL
jgi:hypothetical protein